MRYEAPDGIPNLRLPGDTRTEVVRRFYERAPFPDYPPRGCLSWLRARAERSEFARLIDRAIPGDARVVEIGCGTGQMSLYLARADRVVISADLTRASLTLGAAAARRFGLDQVQFVETDLHYPGMRARPISASRGAPSHPGRGPGLVCRKWRRIPARVPKRSAVSGLRGVVRYRRRQLAS